VHEEQKQYNTSATQLDRAFTVQIHKLIDLHKHISFYEALMNEIGVYMCCPRQSFFMNFRQVYEDKIHLYVVFEYWHGEQLSKVLATTRLSQVQMNSIMLQLIKAAKYLHNNGLYHGMITPNNIIISKPQINTQ
jgi:serine/threonine protein kinase